MALFVLCSARAEAELLEPLSDIYWQGTPFASMATSSPPDSLAEHDTCVADHITSFPEQAPPTAPGKPAIAIVIDDMGLDRIRSARAVLLPPQITLAYLPYSPFIKDQTKAARDKGHSLIVHMPMEPDRKTADPGPNCLETGLSPLALHDRIAANLAAFEEYIGVNNHMGSKFSRDEDSLRLLMTELKSRGLVFFDSKTVPDSAGEKIAREMNVATTHRDVFIDHFQDEEKIEHSLRQIENIARHTGSAVAIGHPRDMTLDALEKWLPSLEKKGFRLVTLKEVIGLREKQKTTPAVGATIANHVAGKEPDHAIP